MLRSLVFVCVVGAIAAFAPSARAEVRVQRVEYKHGETVLEGILAFDDAFKQKRPGVLVCQEWWGVNDYMEKRVRQLAQLGYVAFALDMYGKGKSTTDPAQAGQWAKALMSDPKAMRERAAAGLKVLSQHSDTDASRLAVIGYCMGGTVALELARSGLPGTDRLLAVVPFHASNVAAKNAEDDKNIKGTVLVCHGAADTFVKPGELETAQRQFADAGVDFEIVSYARAVHAFTNPNAGKFGVPGVDYDAKADKRSWDRMLALFREVLGPLPTKP